MPVQSAWALVLAHLAQREFEDGALSSIERRVRIVLGTGLGFVAIRDE